MSGQNSFTSSINIYRVPTVGRHCVKLQRYREGSILALRVFANWGKSWGNEDALNREGAVIHKVLKDTQVWGS